ncbi:MAG: TadE-like [Mycobacterium sp.]|nr:TadE-like [Mycobacterium sp.]
MRWPPPQRDEAGSAVVDFVLVEALLLFVTFGVIQVGLVLHARNVLASDAAEGARHAASLAVPVSSGATLAEDLARRSVPGAGKGLTCTSRETTGAGGIELAEITCVADLHLTFVPMGSIHLSVTGRSIKEVAQ